MGGDFVRGDKHSESFHQELGVHQRGPFLDLGAGEFRQSFRHLQAAVLRISREEHMLERVGSIGGAAASRDVPHSACMHHSLSRKEEKESGRFHGW